MVRNYDLHAAIARINAARANLGLARSDQFPQFDATADVTSIRTSKNGQFGSVAQGGRGRNIGSVFLNLVTFELDVWGRLRQQTKAARAELRASEEDRKAVLTTVVGDVAAGYFSLLELDSELEIAKRTLATREEESGLITFWPSMKESSESPAPRIFRQGRVLGFPNRINRKDFGLTLNTALRQVGYMWVTK